MTGGDVYVEQEEAKFLLDLLAKAGDTTDTYTTAGILRTKLEPIAYPRAHVAPLTD